MAIDGRSVTLLHLSDLQFGAHHRFGAEENLLSSASLLTSLKRDLDELREHHAVAPDVVLVTGDLAERGGRPEFHQMLAFLIGLAEHLPLPRNRLAVIPGNHDLNWAACEAYFAECRSDDLQPTPPYWPKWKHFVWMFREFYRDHPEITFTEEQPWTLFEIPELSVVIAGLNSTMVESHRPEDHYGAIGAAQVEWFAEKLRAKVDDGWLRLAAVHHNVRRKAVADDENLHDSERLDRLKPLINAVLHGHTHDGKLDYLTPKIPILSTGSAAVERTARPPEIPNQYQLVRFTAGGMTRWTRAYLADRHQWSGDNRGSDEGDRWTVETEISLERTHQALAVPASREERPPAEKSPAEDGHERGLYPPFKSTARDDLLSRVESACRAGADTNVSTERIHAPLDPLPYLRVTERDGQFTSSYVIGVADGEVDNELINLFAATIHRRARQHDSRATSKLVYGGVKRASSALTWKANHLGIDLKSWVEFQGLIDFRSYLERQRERLVRDARYPPELYVPQRIQYSVGGENRNSDDALGELDQWISTPEGRFVLVLGEFGTGKSFLLRQLALRLSEPGRPEPILIEMRTLEKGRTLDELIVQHLVRSGFESFHLPAFRYMLDQGRIALLFDGFDELAGRISYDRAVEHFETVAQAARGAAKVVVSSRTQFFESDSQVRTALAERVDRLTGQRVVRLQRFDRQQIKAFLVNKIGDEERAEARLRLLAQVRDLMGLSENPRMLGFIAELSEEELRDAAERKGKITAAELYRLLIDRWLAFEEKRIDVLSIAITERLSAVTMLALQLWQKVDATARLSELSSEVAKMVSVLVERKIELGEATHQVASGTLLVRDEDGNFSFVHQSILEWLVASAAAAELNAGAGAQFLGARELSPLMADFVLDLAGENVASWAQQIIATDGSAGPTLKRNAKALLDRASLGTETPLELRKAKFIGEDLRARDFSGQTLYQAEFTFADLSDSRFVDAALTNADLSHTKLVRADLTRANLSGADLRNADLSHARLFATNLSGANLGGASLRRAKLIGAVLPEMDVDTFGASSTEARVEPIFEGPLRPRALAWSPRGEFLAMGETTVVRLWDVALGEELRRFHHPGGSPIMMTFCLGGTVLAALGANGSVIFWNIADGSTYWTTAPFPSKGVSLRSSSGGTHIYLIAENGSIQHLDAIEKNSLLVAPALSAVAVVTGRYFQSSNQWLLVTTDGRLLSGNRAGLIRELQLDTGTVDAADISSDAGILAVASGMVLSTHNSQNGMRSWEKKTHTTPIKELAFDREGNRLASQSRGGTVRLWGATSGKLLATFEGNSGAYDGLAFSADGELIASGLFADGIHIWSTSAHTETQRLASPAKGIQRVAFIAGSTRLLTSDGEQVVIWNLDEGRPLSRSRGRLLLACSEDGKAWLDDLNGMIRVNFTTSGRAQFVTKLWAHVPCAVDVDRDRIAVSTLNTHIEVSGIRDRRPAKLVGITNEAIRVLAFSPGGTLASATTTGEINVWGRFGTTSTSVETGAHNISALYVSDDGRVLALTPTAVLRISNDEVAMRYPGTYSACAFSRNGALFAVGDAEGRVSIFGADGQSVRDALEHDAGVTSLSFDEEGKTLASGSLDGTVRLWEIAALQTVAVLASLPNGAVAYTPNGRSRLTEETGHSFGFVSGLCRFTRDELRTGTLLAPDWDSSALGGD